MILSDGDMKYESEVKEKTKYENRDSFRFKEDHKGSFVVMASMKKEKMVKGKVGNAVRIAKKTMSINRNKIIKIKNLGYNKSEIHLKDAITANKLMDLKKRDVEYYVPGRAMRTKGVVIDWDKELPIHEMYEAMSIEERRGILQIDRMKKRIYNRERQENMSVDTDSLIVTWEGNARPEKISLWNDIMTLRVRPYIESVRQCYKL